MRWRFILKIIGLLIFFFGLTMVFSILVGMHYRDTSLIPLVESMAITVAAGFILYLLFRNAEAPGGLEPLVVGRRNRDLAGWPWLEGVKMNVVSKSRQLLGQSWNRIRRARVIAVDV